MKDLLFVKNLHLPVFAATKPESKTTEEWIFENQRVCAFIRQWVGDNVLNHVMNETDAKVLWNKLETLYAPKTFNNKFFLMKQARRLVYKEGSSMSDHLNKFQECFDQLLDMGMKLNDEILAIWLLNTLPDSWETFKISLINASPSEILTTEYVKSGVLNEEMRRRTQGRGRSKQTSQGQNNRGRSRSKSKPRYKDLECYFCGKTGHIKRYCYKWKKENHTSNGKHQKKGNNDNFNRVNTTSSHDLLVVYDENLIIEPDLW